ncbi:hypothetical protein [Roseibium aggregatum]|uniref:Uncharacterized protein n=1 Tax=Roseibium aggregatum TaxID=187304 RepID=A0A926P389_9HYPH|nr:hypothetical protein [Roseibium aggregatum]MBD1545792.1 hypothetical protein [Roseibium aggregatum]
MIRYALAATLLIAPVTTQAAQMETGGHMGHDHQMQHNAGTGMQATGMQTQQTPTEPGQGAFAAIQEIVNLLAADPETDWSKVNIPALRAHLIDMNNVTLHAKAEATPVDNGYRFTVTGSGEVKESIRRMVKAHAATMNGVAGFSYTAEDSVDGAVLTVTVADPADLTKLHALGFIGVMTLGAHHQAHHLAIAEGMSPHH